MALLSTPIDINEIPESSGDGNFAPLPEGWYTASITSAELKPTKAGTGEYIAVRYDIIAPTHQGRVVFGNLNIKNPSIKAEEIAYQQIGKIARAGGLKVFNDTDQLIGITLDIKLAIQKSEQYGDSNDIKDFKAPNNSVAPMPEQNGLPKQSGSTPPWAKK